MKKLNAFLGVTMSLLMLTSCSKSSSSDSTPAVVVPTSPSISSTPNTNNNVVPPVTPVTPVTPDATTPDVTSSASVQMVRSDIPVGFVAMTGPTGMGAASMLDDNNTDSTANPYVVSVVSSNDQVAAMLASGETDIACMSTTVAATLYNRMGDVSVLAVNTLGVLYLMEKGDVSVSTIEELAGQTIWATGQGSNPEYILNKLLAQAGVAGEVTVEWMTSEEVSAKMASEENGICMLPVPASTALLLSDESIREAVDVSTEWERLVGASLPMGCVVVRNEYLEENPTGVENFMRDYEISIERMQKPTEDRIQYVVDGGIVPSYAIAEAALPKANLTYTIDSAMQSMLEEFYLVMFEADPESIGGGMPYDDFYFYG